METTVLAEKPEFQKIEKEGASLQEQANSFIIKDDESRAEAAEALKQINIRVSQVETLTESPWRSALNAYEEVQQWRKNLIAKFTGPKKTYAAKIGEWDLMIATKRRKEQEIADAKALKEANEKRQAEIAAAKKAKDKAAVEELKSAPVIPVAAAPKTQEPSKVSGVSTRFEWKLSSINGPKVPAEFHVIVQKTDGTYVCKCVDIIKDRIKSLGDNHGIPGVSAKQVPITSGRA